MGNVKAGNFVDNETGEALNDVEKVLGKLGINLRDNQNEFRNFGSVLDEVGQKWESFSGVQQKAIATALAGTRQQEKLIVLFENYGDALEYAETATNSAGTANAKYQEAYLDSIEAKLNSLKATWEQFSMGILDSSFVKMLLDVVNGLASVLSAIGSFGGGIITFTGAAGVALLALNVVLNKIKASREAHNMAAEEEIALMQKEILVAGQAKTEEEALALAKEKHAAAAKKAALAMVAYMAATAALSIAISLMNNKAKATPQRFAAIISGILAATSAIVLGLRIVKNGIQSFMASNPFGWIMLGISALVTMVTAITNASKAAAVAARNHADKMKEEADASKQVAKELKDLTKEYKKLGDELEDGEEFSAENVKRIAEIQSEIVDLLGYQVGNIDLVNGGYKDQLDILKKLYAERAKIAADDAKIALQAEKEAQSKELGGATINPLSHIGLLKKEKDTVHGDLLNIKGFNSKKYYELGQTGYKYTLDQNAPLETQLNAVNEALKVLEPYKKNEVKAYSQLVSLKAQLEERQQKLKPLVAEVLKLSAEQIATENYNIWNDLPEYEKRKKANYAEAFEIRKQQLVDELSKVEELVEAFPDVKDRLEKAELSIDNWLAQNYSQEYADYIKSKNPLRAVIESYAEMLDEWQGGFDALNKALESFAVNGIVAPNEIKNLFKDFPDLKDYFNLTDQGYVLAENFGTAQDALEDYINNALREYIEVIKDCEADVKNFAGDAEKLKFAQESLANAQENLNTATATFASLLRSSAIKEATERLNEQKDALKGQLDNYKSLIDIRKDLLKSYKQEIDYQKQLAQKQKAVVDLQTQLQLARLDTSAAGKAKTRELESQLADAQSALDDFTLEHAIEVLTKQLDDEHEEYAELINSQTDELVKAINELAKKLQIKITTENGEPNVAVEYPNYHIGGYVGGVKTNEEFAKLMKGEFVVTPPQIRSFMNQTLPNIATNNSNSNANNYNAPLIKIDFASVTKESIPDVEKIVNRAVNEVQQIMESGGTRTGRKNSANPFVRNQI